jgi:hypothetical protein
MTTVGIATAPAVGWGLACAQRLVDTVDALPFVDVDEASPTAAAKELAGPGRAALVELFVLEVTDGEGVGFRNRAACAEQRESGSGTIGRWPYPSSTSWYACSSTCCLDASAASTPKTSRSPSCPSA